MYYSPGRYFVIAFVFPAEVPKRLPDNEDARELPKPSAVPIYSLCRKTQWGSIALNIKLIEQTTVTSLDFEP